MTPNMTEFEEKLVRSLREMPAEWTPACLPEETLWDFAEQGGKHPDAINLIRHIVSCGYCSQGYLAMKETLALRRQLALSEETERTPEPSSGGWERLLLFLKAPPVLPRFALGAGALAGVAILLLLLWPQWRLSRQTQVALEKEKKAHAETRRLLASAREGSQNGTSESSAPTLFPTDPKSVEPPRSKLAPLQESRVTLGGDEQNTIVLLRPNGTFVPSLRPLFVWKLEKTPPEVSARIRGYKVTIVNVNNMEDVVTFSVEAPKGAPQEVFGQIPPDKPALKPGGAYRWSVSALPGPDANDEALNLPRSSPHQETRFRVLTASEMGRLGKILTQFGALDDAEQALEADPEDVNVRKTLENVRKMRRRPAP